MSNSEKSSFLNQLFVSFYKIPWIKSRWAKNFDALSFDTIPWTQVKKPLGECRLALVTTSGVHLTNEPAFNMVDKEGDPSFRVIPWPPSEEEITFTHDYYDHSDAEKDINVAIPVAPLQQCIEEGIIGSAASKIYSFMGHIIGKHLPTLVKESASNVVRQLHEDKVDIVVLSPA